MDSGSLVTSGPELTMTDCHAYFLDFEYEITPSVSELMRSLEMRRSIRKAIAGYCAGLGISVQFHPQGSFRLLTAVRRDGLDLDDGVLFRVESFARRPTIDELHELIFAAVRAGGFSAFARLPCLRLLQPRGVRIDIVAYLRDRDGRIHLAHHKDGWVPAHSSHLIAWFESPVEAQAALQMRRIVKYYKMWAARQAPNAMASGVAMTILVKMVHCPDGRDDVAFTRTMGAVYRHLASGGGCPRPTPPAGEELLKDELSPNQLRRFLDLLRGLIDVSEGGLDSESLEASVLCWQSQFGPAFGGVGRQVTAQNRAWQLRRILQDFDGLSGRRADASESAARERSPRWTL
jgi:hypothetical protein